MGKVAHTVRCERDRAIKYDEGEFFVARQFLFGRPFRAITCVPVSSRIGGDFRGVPVVGSAPTVASRLGQPRLLFEGRTNKNLLKSAMYSVVDCIFLYGFFAFNGGVQMKSRFGVIESLSASH